MVRTSLTSSIGASTGQFEPLVPDVVSHPLSLSFHGFAVFHDTNGRLHNLRILMARFFLILEYLDTLQVPDKKEKVVVLGSGWGALAVLQELNRLKYDVTVVSPRNYFVFTPLIADAAVGAVDAEKYVAFFRFSVILSLQNP